MRGSCRRRLPRTPALFLLIGGALLSPPATRAAPAAPEETLTEMRGRLRRIEGMVEGADAAPTATAQALFEQTSQSVDRLLAAWTEVKTTKLPAVNQQITGAGLPAIEITNAPPSTRSPGGK